MNTESAKRIVASLESVLSTENVKRCTWAGVQSLEIQALIYTATVKKIVCRVGGEPSHNN
jgi:hypothetical protein